MSRWVYEFWRDVADPSWPKVVFWSDFVQVNDKLKEEVYLQHDFSKRLLELDNRDLWRCKNLATFELYKKDHFVFINVPKCGSRHYRQFFLDRLEWDFFVPESIKDLEQYTLFGLMMDPHRRYLKGVTEWLWTLHVRHGIDLDWKKIDLLIPDGHSLPLSMILDTLMMRIAWIPFEILSDQEVKQSMNNLFQKKGSTLSIPISHPPVHVSSSAKKTLYDQLELYFYNHDIQQTPITMIHQLLISDFQFYRELTKNFTPDWQHLD